MSPGRRTRAESRFKAEASRLAILIRTEREKRSENQETLAVHAQVSTSWLAKLERGEIVEPGLFPVLSVLREMNVSFERLDDGKT